MKYSAIFLFFVLVILYYFFYAPQIKYQVHNTSSQSEAYVASKDEILSARFMLMNQEVSVGSIMSREKSQEVLLHFWATWCGPCLEELPRLYNYALRQSKESNKVSYIFIAVNDTPHNIDVFLKKAGIDRKIGSWVFDNNQTTFKVFRIDKLPETYILRSDSDVSRLIGSQEWR